MTNAARFFTLLLVLLCCFSYDADAQFWKKWFNKKNDRVERLDDRAPVIKDSDGNDKKQPVIQPKTDPHEILYPQSVKKDRYRVDLLMPLYLNELVADSVAVYRTTIPKKALPSIQFYEGVAIAADTLKKLGYKLDIYVHDVTDELESVETLVNAGSLDNSDLVIGLVSSKYFPTIARFAKRNNINFISALSPSDDDIQNNPYFTMLQPTLQTHCDVVQDKMFEKYKRAPRVMLYRSDIPVDNAAHQYFLSDEQVPYIKYNCDKIPTKEQLSPLFDNTQVNVVLMPIISDEYAAELLKKLYEWFPEMNFEVWGMPSWNDMKDLKKPNAFPNVAVFYTSPYYFDVSTASGQALVRNYEANYGSSTPDYMVFRGYETLYWYAYLLKRYGTIFNPYVIDNGMAPFTRYKIKMTFDTDDKPLYNENKHLYLFRYQGSSYIVSQ